MIEVTGRRAVLAERAWPGVGLERTAALVLGGALLTALCSRIEIPLLPVPITGQTFGVLLVGALLGSRRGLASMLVYVGMGAFGLPVFAGGTSGLARQRVTWWGSWSRPVSSACSVSVAGTAASSPPRRRWRSAPWSSMYSASHGWPISWEGAECCQPGFSPSWWAMHSNSPWRPWPCPGPGASSASLIGPDHLRHVFHILLGTPNVVRL